MKLEGKGYIIAKNTESRAKKDGQGEWTITNLVIEFEGYKKKSILSTKTFKDVEYDIGDLVEITATVESREYNGKYYTDVVLFDISSPTFKNVELEKTPSGAIDLSSFETSTQGELPF